MSEETKQLLSTAEKNTAGASLSAAQRVQNRLLEWFPAIGLVLMVVFFQLVTGGKLLTPYNMKSISGQMFLYVLGGFGCLFLFAQGGIDLSMAANIGMSAIVGARIMEVSVPLGIVATILSGTAVGVIMGIIYAFAEIPVFIQGLAMNFLLNGLLWPLSAGMSSIPAPQTLTNLKSNIGEILIMLITLGLIVIIYNYTRFGKECRAIGAGAISSVQSGVNVKKCKIWAFIITGFTCGIVALLSLIRTGSATQATGANFNFNTMLCLVLGGCVMGGGAGVKVRNAVLGAAILIVLQNGLILWGANIRVQDIVKGVLLILMIVATTKLRTKIEK